MLNLIFSLRFKFRLKSFTCLFTSLLFMPMLAVSADKSPTPVIAYQVQQIDQPQHIKALGDLQALHTIQVAATVTETIQAIHFEDGQNVQKNQLLLELSNNEELALLAEAVALVTESKQQYQRVKDVLGRGSVTQSLVDEKYSIWQSAVANQRVVQAQLADRKIYAPFAGQLGFSALSVGALITPSTPIVSLDDNRVMKLNLFAATEYLPVLNIGQSVTIRSSAFPTQNFQGQISAISPQLEQNLRMIKVIALIDNAERLLKTNMMVEVLIDLPAKQQLIVPNTALLMLGDKQYIYRLKAQSGNVYQAEKIEVQTGEIGQTYTEITSGLKANDLIVSQGVMRVKPKANITIKALQGSMLQEQLLQEALKPNPSIKSPKNPVNSSMRTFDHSFSNTDQAV